MPINSEQVTWYTISCDDCGLVSEVHGRNVDALTMTLTEVGSWTIVGDKCLCRDCSVKISGWSGTKAYSHEDKQAAISNLQKRIDALTSAQEG